MPELPEISFSLTFLQTRVERVCDILVLQGVGGDSKLEDNIILSVKIHPN